MLVKKPLTPVYKELAAWKEDLTQLSSIEDAPSQLIDYIDFLEKELETPIVVVSVGPDKPKLLTDKHLILLRKMALMIVFINVIYAPEKVKHPNH